jgi:hypothetical protein
MFVDACTQPNSYQPHRPVLDSHSCSRHADRHAVGFHTAGDEYVELPRLLQILRRPLDLFTSPAVCFLLTASSPGMPLLCNPQVVAVTWTAFTYQNSCAADRQLVVRALPQDADLVPWLAFAAPLNLQGQLPISLLAPHDGPGISVSVFVSIPPQDLHSVHVHTVWLTVPEANCFVDMCIDMTKMRTKETP